MFYSQKPEHSLLFHRQLSNRSNPFFRSLDALCPPACALRLDKIIDSLNRFPLAREKKRREAQEAEERRRQRERMGGFEVREIRDQRSEIKGHRLKIKVRLQLQQLDNSPKHKRNARIQTERSFLQVCRILWNFRHHFLSSRDREQNLATALNEISIIIPIV